MQHKTAETCGIGKYLDDATRFGPSHSGEPESGKTKKRKFDMNKENRKINHMGAFKDGKDYWNNRVLNVNRAPEECELYSALLNSDADKEQRSQLFKGMTFYLNSAAHTTIPSYHLTKLIALHGGVLLPFLSKAVTHVLCHNLSAAKDKLAQKKFGRVQYLHPDFVLDSMRAGRRQPPGPYAVAGAVPRQAALPAWFPPGPCPAPSGNPPNPEGGAANSRHGDSSAAEAEPKEIVDVDDDSAEDGPESQADLVASGSRFPAHAHFPTAGSASNPPLEVSDDEYDLFGGISDSADSS